MATSEVAAAPRQEIAGQKQEIAGQEHTWAGRTYSPAVDISETDDSLWLWADMPGVDERSVDVRLEDDVLSLSGKVALEEYNDFEPAYIEYNVGNFHRTFRLPEKIDRDRIRARMVQGTLEVELPKLHEARTRQIPISA
jgi:HSP20 family molecular chaperone IbpA